MAEQPSESIKLDVDPLETYLRQTPAIIERDKARTANRVTMLLIFGLLWALPLYLVAVLATMWIKPDTSNLVSSVFDKWFSVVGPLAGTAIGAYYGSRIDLEQGRRRR